MQLFRPPCTRSLANNTKKGFMCNHEYVVKVFSIYPSCSYWITLVSRGGGAAATILLLLSLLCGPYCTECVKEDLLD